MELLAIIKSVVTIFSAALISIFAVSYLLFRFKNKKNSINIKNSSPDHPSQNNYNFQKKSELKKQTHHLKRELRFKVLNNLNENIESAQGTLNIKSPAQKISIKRITTLR